MPRSTREWIAWRIVHVGLALLAIVLLVVILCTF